MGEIGKLDTFSRNWCPWLQALHGYMWTWEKKTVLHMKFQVEVAEPAFLLGDEVVLPQIFHALSVNTSRSTAKNPPQPVLIKPSTLRPQPNPVDVHD